MGRDHADCGEVSCVPQTLHEWVKKVEVDSGRKPGVTTDMAEKMKALERENRELRQANEILRVVAKPRSAWTPARILPRRSSTADGSHDQLRRCVSR
ncbi:MAG: hypothetical protein H7X92_13390 [Chitinophagales bacterium]|nr:hypothetical protein [Hyphomicrobiales bacterium]